MSRRDMWAPSLNCLHDQTILVWDPAAGFPEWVCELPVASPMTNHINAFLISWAPFSTIGTAVMLMER